MATKLFILVDGVDGPNAWKLERLKVYTINNCAFETMEEMIIKCSVTDDIGVSSSWYKEKDFISIIEARKKKLEQIEKLNN